MRRSVLAIALRLPDALSEPAASEEDDAGYSTRFVIDVVITVILILATYSLVHPAFDNDDLHQCFSTADGDMNCANMGHHW